MVSKEERKWIVIRGKNDSDIFMKTGLIPPPFSYTYNICILLLCYEIAVCISFKLIMWIFTNYVTVKKQLFEYSGIILHCSYCF